MVVSHLNHWPCLATIFELMVSACLTILDALNHAARAIGPYIWAALEWTANLLVAAGNTLVAAILVLLLWISIIYLCCFAIYMFCKLLRPHQKHKNRGERQPLLARPERRRRLPSWTSSNSSGERRRHHDHQAHRDLFRVEIDRRRQDVLRREQHRAVETRSRQYRERRLREALQQSTSTPLYGQSQTIITWLQTSAGSTTITHYPHYGTLPTRGAQSQPRPQRRPDPPPPYSNNVAGQPPPYSVPRHDSPPAYD